MNRLSAELERLYGVPAAALPGDAPTLLSPEGLTRCLVLQLADPADWTLLAAVWLGVQNELDWPAPAIAINGDAGYQLWFSLKAPIAVAEAQSLLLSLQTRYLAEVADARLQRWPRLGCDSAEHARPVPAPCGDGEHWSAFVAPDLAPVFADTPSLDLPPSPEGQADLLASLRSITPTELAQALKALLPAQALSDAPPGPPRAALPTGQSSERATNPAQAFLLKVMHDESVDLALRVKAAEALLPYF